MSILNAEKDKIYRIDDGMMIKMNIPKIDPINDKEELWKLAEFCNENHRFDKSYLVSTYGRVYDLKYGKLLKEELSWYKSGVNHYRQVRIRTKGDRKGYMLFLLHRLVLGTYVPMNKERPIVNHIDADPSHNYLWNLEWCTAKENYWHAVKSGLVKDIKGVDRYNALWTDDEIRLVCQLMEDGHKATYIFNYLAEILKDPKVQYERVRTLYKHIRRRTHWTHISKDYDIDFSSYNYLKEMGSVKKAKSRKSKRKKSTGGSKTS